MKRLWLSALCALITPTWVSAQEIQTFGDNKAYVVMAPGPNSCDGTNITNLAAERDGWLYLSEALVRDPSDRDGYVTWRAKGGQMEVYLSFYRVLSDCSMQERREDVRQLTDYEEARTYYIQLLNTKVGD